MNEFNENNNPQNDPVMPQPQNNAPEVNNEPVVPQPQDNSPEVNNEPENSAPVVNDEPENSAHQSQDYSYRVNNEPERQWQNQAPKSTFTYHVPNGGFQPENQQPPKKNTGMKVFVSLLAGFIGICIIFGIADIIHKKLNDTPLSSNPTSESTTVQEQESEQEFTTSNEKNTLSSVSQVAQKVSPSVVGITVYSDQSSASSQASGVIMNKKGYILTNDHIYADIPSPKFVITLNDGKSYEATYHAGDARSDLAVLLMKKVPENITPAVLGNSDYVQAGDDVVAIGSPAGLSDTVTKGIISAPSRRITSASSESSTATANYTMKVIQTDTAINPGNSGGALVNMNGEVIGINSSKIVLTGYEGIGFAIPSNNAKAVFTDLTKHGKVVNRGRVGLTYTEITSSIALVNNMRMGLLIRSIDTKCSLYNTNVSAGDIIIGVNGKEITTEDDLLDIIESNPGGTEIELTIYLNASGRQVTHKVTLLEDDSQSSYTTYQPQTTQPNPFSFDFDFGY